MLISTDGLVTRSFVTATGDQMLHLVTPDMGRLSVIVKGSRKQGNRFASIIQLFTWGNYELYQKGDLYWLRGGSVLTPFYELSSDLPAMALAAYLCDVTSDMTGEGEPAEHLLRMLLNALYVLRKGDKPREIIKGVFELRAMAMSGYYPDLEECAVCGETQPSHAYMDVMNGRLICDECQGSLNRQRVFNDEMSRELLGERRIMCPITASTLAAMRYALSAPEKKIFSFHLADQDEIRIFAHVAETYLLNHLERDFETLKFYRSVE